MLDQAKNGELIGHAGITMFRNKSVGYLFLGECARKPNSTREYLKTLRERILA